MKMRNKIIFLVMLFGFASSKSAEIELIPAGEPQEQDVEISDQNLAQEQKTDLGQQELNKKTIELLQKILADEFALYVETLNYHWNVRGINFNSLHAFFKGQYEDLFAFIDLIAERIRALNGKPLASMAEYLQQTQLTEDLVGNYKDDRDMILKLLVEHKKLIALLQRSIRAIQDDYNDWGTANLLLGVLEKHEKIAWMLEASKYQHNPRGLGPRGLHLKKQGIY
jgi:starvation-inducible DNA-binding protein